MSYITYVTKLFYFMNLYFLRLFRRSTVRKSGDILNQGLSVTVQELKRKKLCFIYLFLNLLHANQNGSKLDTQSGRKSTDVNSRMFVTNHAKCIN